MAYELQENQITVFLNKEKKDKQPEWKGEAKINGVLMDVAFWVRTGAKGEFLSGKISEKRLRNDVLNNAAKKDEF
jgi:hypothetical protein